MHEQQYSTPTPAFSILEGNIDFPSQIQAVVPQKPAWLSQYDNSAILRMNGTESPPIPSDVLGMTYNSQGVDNNTSFLSNTPESYTVAQNQNLERKLRQFNMPSEAVDPLPEQLSVPQFTPPYGTPYPSTGYSAYDHELVKNSKVPMAIAQIPLPIASPPGVEDARNYPSSQMRENFHGSCAHSIQHLIGCSVCKGLIFNKEQMMFSIIIILGVICIVLLILLLRRR